MAVKIRLKRMGKIRTPFYRIVVADSRTKRDGRVIEEIGTYNPKTDPSTIHVQSERAQYWLGVGAQPTEAVAAILKITGDIGGTSTLKMPEAKPDKAETFDAALKQMHAEPKAEATTKKTKKATPKVADSEQAASDQAQAGSESVDSAKAAPEASTEDPPAEAPEASDPDASDSDASDPAASDGAADATKDEA